MKASETMILTAQITAKSAQNYNTTMRIQNCDDCQKLCRQISQSNILQTKNLRKSWFQQHKSWQNDNEVKTI